MRLKSTKHKITLKQIIKDMFKNPIQITPTKNQHLKQNIYGSKNPTEHIRKWKVIHTIFKRRLLMPGMWLIRKTMGKHLTDKIPKGNHNTNIQAFNKAYEQAITDWNLTYRRWMEQPTGKMLPKTYWKQETQNNYSNQLLRTLKQLIITMALNDTAYREFLNILMHNITKTMIQEYKTELQEKLPILHLLSTGQDVYTPEYFAIWREIRKDTKIIMKHVKL